MPEKARIDYGGRNVPVNDAARIMGKSPQFIRVGLQRGILPFGVAFKVDENNEQYDYYISPKQFADYTGYLIEDVSDVQDHVVTANMLTTVNKEDENEKQNN